ncbi:hypothetical protein FHW89_003848 [Mucilaginibacter sp. SG564]|nr:hypothetical protein [Mucilaginibacter sp. SG564]
MIHQDRIDTWHIRKGHDRLIRLSFSGNPGIHKTNIKVFYEMLKILA